MVNRRPCGVSCKRVMAGPVRGAGPGALDLLRALPRVSLANLRQNQGKAPGNRKDDEEVREEVGSVAGATRENVREEPGPGWALWRPDSILPLNPKIRV